MQNNLIKSIILSLLLMGCEQNKSNEIKNTQPELVELKDFLKEVHFSDSALLIWRTGSIQWSELGSLLVLNKSENSEDTTIDVNYYEFYDGWNDAGKSYAKYNFSLNDKCKSYNLISSFLTKTSSDRKINRIQSEGACANLYYLEMDNKTLTITHSDKQNIVNCIKGLWRQISPKEYFQSLSLEKNCEELKELKEKLFFGKMSDSLFHIPFEKCLPTWNGKELIKKVLPNGGIIYFKPK